MRRCNAYALCIMALCLATAGAGYRPVAVALHVQSTYSDDGVATLEDIAATARKTGVRVVILADHDLMRWEYGLPPLRSVLRRRVERISVLKAGPRAYLDHIDRINRANPDLLLIPGVESAPFYYWSGSPFDTAGLTMHQWHKHLLLAGLPDSAAYAQLPLVGNGAAFDQYHGDQGDAPYQALIDYVNRVAPSTGLIIWAHPESPNFATPQRNGNVSVVTPPYPRSLVATHGYTGFAYFQEGDRAVGAPGGIWDTLLNDYCAGKRAAPVWAFAELDYRGEGYLGTYFNSFRNMLLTDSREPLDAAAVLRTLRAGNFYIAQLKHGGTDILLTEYALSGTTLVAAVEAIDGSSHPVDIRLISGGAVIARRSALTPTRLLFTLPAGGAARRYYRLEIVSPDNTTIITNPLFTGQ